MKPVNGRELEQAILEECTKEVGHALSKYGCMLVFEQLLHNGIPIGPGKFRVIKAPEESQSLNQ
jgi:hypothetical protein